MYAQRRFVSFCGQEAMQTASHAGVAGRLAIYGWDQISLLIVPQIGLTAINTFESGALDAEIGLGFRFGQVQGPFLQPGIEATVANSLFMRGNYAFGPAADRSDPIDKGLREGSLDLGGRIAPAVTQTCFVVGRPLRRGSGRASLPVAYLATDSSAPSGGGSSPMAKRIQAARLWAARAATEWASIPAFWELADQLAACGAPIALQQRALAAAEDEIGHALSAAKLAASLAGVRLALEPPVLVPRDPEIGRAGLLRLASESWTDGCLGEGAAAACAAAEAQVAGSRVIRSMQRTIADDEGRHAELGWNVLTWALSQADAETAAAIRGLAAQALPNATPGSDHDGLDAFGCLSPAAQTIVVTRHGHDAATRFRAVVGV
jgi:hypothetical protein